MQNYMLIGFSFEIYKALTSTFGAEPAAFLINEHSSRRKIKEKFHKDPLMPYDKLRRVEDFSFFNLTAGDKRFFELFNQMSKHKETFANCTIQYNHILTRKLKIKHRYPNREEIENKFYLACLNAYNTIKSHELNCIIFADIPHEGGIYAYYAMAKVMNIPTIICRQSFSYDYFYITEDIKDGTPSGIIGNNKGFRVKFTDGPKKPSYMLNKKTLCKFPCQEVIDVITKSSCLLPILKGSSKFERLRRSYSKYTYQKYYQNNLSQTIKANLKYVYFPLHEQPEMTTNSIGGKYVNQALAIYELRRAIPQEYIIVVKENPSQDWYMREKSFFRIINELPNVIYAPLESNSHELCQKAVATATVTGTAGFESLYYKKPVICFGSPWYKNLPGVFEFKNIKDIAEVLNFTFNDSELQEAIDKFTSQLFHGFVPQHYASAWNKTSLNITTNAGNIANAIGSYLAQREI